MKSLVVVGAGGFGREVLDVALAVNEQGPTWDVRGVVDDHPTATNLERLERRSVPYLGTIDEQEAPPEPVWYAVGVGSPSARRTIAAKLDAVGYQPATLVHPDASMGFDVTVGDGSVVCAGVRVTTNIVLGRHVHLNLNSTVGHDTIIGDYVSVNPLASISGDCTIEAGVLIGVAAVILNGRTVHEGATVGGSACVVRDVEAGAVVKGIPAK